MPNVYVEARPKGRPEGSRMPRRLDCGIERLDQPGDPYPAVGPASRESPHCILNDPVRCALDGGNPRDRMHGPLLTLLQWPLSSALYSERYSDRDEVRVGTEFKIGKMTGFETVEDGSSISLGMEDVAGRPLSLRMTLECLNQLMMTLPGMVRQAVQRQHRNPSLRIVYPLARFQLELADDFETRILTLETPDGFSVSFGLTEEQRREIATDHPSESPTGRLVN